MSLAWLYYNPFTHELIVKREPLPYQFPHTDMSTGEVDIIFIYGEQIYIPQWDWVKTKGDSTLAGWQNRVYDITDYVADGKLNPN